MSVDEMVYPWTEDLSLRDVGDPYRQFRSTSAPRPPPRALPRPAPSLSLRFVFL